MLHSIEARSVRPYLSSGCWRFLGFHAAPALAETTGPQWTVTAVSSPTNFAVGGSEDSYVVVVTNSGSARRHGNEEIGQAGRSVPIPVTITDELPAGLEAIPSGVSAEDLLGVTSAASGASSARLRRHGYRRRELHLQRCRAGRRHAVSADPRADGRDTAELLWCGGACGLRAELCDERCARFRGGAAAQGVMETPTSVFAGAKEAK